MTRFALKILSSAIVAVALLTAASDAQARAGRCYIEERQYYDSSACVPGTEVGVWQYGCVGQVIESWGVQTEIFTWHQWYYCTCGDGITEFSGSEGCDTPAAAVE